MSLCHFSFQNFSCHRFLDTSTFEKDGSAVLNAFSNVFWGGDDLPNQNSTLTPIGGKILQGVSGSEYETYYCTTSDCSLIQYYYEAYTPIDGAVSLNRRQGGLMTRVDLPTWKTKIENAYAELNIPTMEDAQIIFSHLY